MIVEDSGRSETKPIDSLDELGVGTNLRFRLIKHDCPKSLKARWSYGRVTAIEEEGFYSVAGLTLPSEATFTTAFSHESSERYEIYVVQEEEVRGRILGSHC